MGCVYYYVLSRRHPFGDNLKRQANILANEYDLSDLSTQQYVRPYESILATQVIADMINKDSSKRPTTEAILKHPLFWREEKILSFFQDVSDRIEKLDLNNEPLRTLERNAKLIVRDDWSLHLHESITSDLRKYRGYFGISVRCLLRALRNKKHHYHELSNDMQKTLGAIPTDFVRYWISRFPHLFSHTYHAMELCSRENIFRRYYCTQYQFTKPDYLSDESLDNFALASSNQEGVKMIAKDKNFGGKKENRAQSNNFTKRNKGAYNFLKVQGNNSKGADVGFITRDMMQSTDVLKGGGENLPKDIVWKL
jgi:serine/threonine-protein kinase/endoribonuclease IRE1